MSGLVAPQGQTSDGIKMAKDLLTKQKIRVLTGYHYLILALIYKYQDAYHPTGFTIAKLKKRLSVKLGATTKQYIATSMTENQAKKCLFELENMGIIHITPPKNNPHAQRRFHRLKIAKRYYDCRNGFIEIYEPLFVAARCHAISYSMFKTSLCVLRLMPDLKHECDYLTLQKIAKYLDSSASAVSRDLVKLSNKGLILITKEKCDGDCSWHNTYQQGLPSEIDGIYLHTVKDENDMLQIYACLNEMSLERVGCS